MTEKNKNDWTYVPKVSEISVKKDIIIIQTCFIMNQYIIRLCPWQIKIISTWFRPLTIEKKKKRKGNKHIKCKLEANDGEIILETFNI